jgi:hypothetical protein
VATREGPSSEQLRGLDSVGGARLVRFVAVLVELAVTVRLLKVLWRVSTGAPMVSAAGWAVAASRKLIFVVCQFFGKSLPNPCTPIVCRSG